MKTMISVIMMSAILAVSLANAESRAQDWKVQRALSAQEDFEALMPGDQVMMNCKKCDAVSMRKIESKDDAMALCQKGKALSCPACKQKATITIRGPRPENPRREVRYVNEHGENCMTMAIVHDYKADPESVHRTPKTPHRSHE